MSAVIFLMGPTATGKTDLAIELLQHFPMEIISVDSAMVYKGMDIGTAKPTSEVLARAPHRLIDICDPSEVYSAARFRQDAIQAIEDIERNGHIPLLVGGTGLYFRALEQGMTELPEADTMIRARLDQEAMSKGLAWLHKRLSEVDPESARRIHANDPQRIKRALEVYEITGKSLTELFKNESAKPLGREIIKLALMPENRELHRQIVKQRFLQMLENGLVEEVRRLHERGDLNASMPSMRMVGYRQIWRYLDNELGYEEMVNHAIVATRQLAKRQMTWLRRERDIYRFNSQDPECTSNILKRLENSKLNNCI